MSTAQARSLFIACVMLLGACLQPVAPARAAAPPARIVGQRPCPNSDFECIAVQVPLDHFDPANPAATNVVFGILPARNPAKRKGMFVTAVGGPGASGLASADSYTAAFDPAIAEVFDIVFFDQRGIGMSGNLRCDADVAAYYQTESRSRTPAEEQATIDNARAFVAACLSRLGNVDELRYYSTRQAVEDLEALRALKGDAKLWLYGESYGTQYAQIYAAAHPDRVAGLILDGVVDMSLTGQRFMHEQTAAFSETLARTLDACTANNACGADMGRDAVRAYDKLARRLERGPLEFSFHRADGVTERRNFALGDLETAASTYLYSQEDRMLLQRAIAYADAGELQPLAMMFYISLGLDPQTLIAKPDPSYSDAAYYAVNCSDYRYFNGTPDERARKYMQAGDRADENIPRMNSVFYGDLPCAFWPIATPPQPYDPAPVREIPTLVLIATADPATPASQGRDVFKRLNNAALIVQQNGPHVIFGRGVACIDDPVTRFLAEGQMPAERQTRCAGEIADDYVSIAPPRARAFDNVLDAVISAENELTRSPGYFAWAQDSRQSEGCLRGGIVAYEHAERGNADVFELAACTFSAGFVMSGSGRLNLERDRFTLKVDVSGNATGTLEYIRNGGRYQVKGTLNGQPVALSR